MRRAFLYIILFLPVIFAQAQTSELDELTMPVLRQKLAASKEDTTRVKLQLALGHLMFSKSIKGQKDIDSAIMFAAQAQSLSSRLNFQFGIINSMLLKSEISYNKGDGAGGVKAAKNALAFSRQHNNSDGEARSYHMISKYFNTGSPAELRTRIWYNDKAIAIFRKNKNNHSLADMLTVNADMLFQADRTTEALRFLFEALNLGKGVSRRTIEGIYWNIGRTSFRLGDYENALKYTLLARETAREVKDTTTQVCTINFFIASCYIKKQDYNRSMPYSKEVISMAKRYNDEGFVRSGAYQLALAYSHTNQLAKALTLLNEMKSRPGGFLKNIALNIEFINTLTYAKHFQQAKEYVTELERVLPKIYPENIQHIMNVHNALAYYYSETGKVNKAYQHTELYAHLAHKLNYSAGIQTAEYRYYQLVSLKGDKKSALAHFQKEKAIKDSIDNVSKAYQISLLHIENAALEKNRHIESLTKDALIKDIKMKRNELSQRATFGGIIVLLIVTALIYSRYRLKQRSNAMLLSQKLEIDEQNNVLKHLVSSKNQLLVEKDLLLKEVNHRVKNNLQIVMSLLASKSVYLSSESAQQAILDSQNRVRSIALIHDQLYKTDNVTQINLALYIKELVDSFDNFLNNDVNNIKIVCEIDDLMLDVSQAIPIGIILNETVTNALKYAFPNHQKGTISICVKQVKTFVEVEISDNGIGLPMDFSLSNVNTLGINLLEGLTAQLGGSFRIKNNNGLTIFLRFPMNSSRQLAYSGLANELAYQ
ncbi:histidine kinase dimerization/phosphoacceptor domain -containing protein [Pedobacter sp. R-06]|uniref:histidine kinase dimerization/phosphoacceptor domain -containing protein n=1 Tax=Pedobacter sp. R-06 TaxID=3404051 RepID=UPI003CF9559B